MAHFLIIHGTEGTPQGNWFAWLKRQLENTGHSVSVPQFPTPKGQTLQNWLVIAQEDLQQHEPENTVIVGHSTGAVFSLHLAERAKSPFQAVYPVCPFTSPLGLKKYDDLNASFILHDFRWSVIKRGSRKWGVFAGDDDPYVPLAQAQAVARRLGCALQTIIGGGHLNAESGYVTFPQLGAFIISGEHR